MLIFISTTHNACCTAQLDISGIKPPTPANSVPPSVRLASEGQSLNALNVPTYQEQFTICPTAQTHAVAHVQQEPTFQAQSHFTANPVVSCVLVAKVLLIIVHPATAAKISFSLTTHALHSALTTTMLTQSLDSACSALRAAKVASEQDSNLALAAKLWQTLHNTISSSIPPNVCFTASQANTATITNVIYVTQHVQRAPHTLAAHHARVSMAKPFSSEAPTVWLSVPPMSMVISVAILVLAAQVDAVHAMGAPSKNAIPAELTQTVLKIT